MDEVFRELGMALVHSQELLVVALIIARTVAMIQLTPFLGGKIVPIEIKMGLSVVISILVWPLARGSVNPAEMTVEALPFMMLMIKEVLIGFIIGFINSHIFTVMDMAGRMIDTARGSSMSEVQDPHSGKRATPTGDMYTQIFLIIFVAIGGHHLFLRAFLYSFEQMPVHKSFDWNDPRVVALFEHVIFTTAELWEIAVLLAAPVMAAVFITDVVFGILNRVAPQLNAYFMAMPVKAFGGVAIILVGLDAVLVRMNDWVVWTLVRVQKAVDLMWPGG